MIPQLHLKMILVINQAIYIYMYIISVQASRCASLGCLPRQEKSEKDEKEKDKDKDKEKDKKEKKDPAHCILAPSMRLRHGGTVNKAQVGLRFQDTRDSTPRVCDVWRLSPSIV